MTEAHIGSAAEYLSLAPEPVVGSPQSVVATLRLNGLEATREVVHNYSSGFTDLADFFGGLAESWRGWAGVRRWESIEHDLLIEATHQHGHVRLRIELRHDLPDWSNDGWRAVGDLTLEPGEQLSAAARDVASLVRG